MNRDDYQRALDDNPGWHRDARCRGVTTDLFYPERGDSATTQAAKAVCAGCPVSAPCLAWGVLHETEGVWGGVAARTLRRLRSEAGVALRTPQTDKTGVWDRGEAPCGTLASYRAGCRCQRCRDANMTYQRGFRQSVGTGAADATLSRSARSFGANTGRTPVVWLENDTQRSVRRPIRDLRDGVAS